MSLAKVPRSGLPKHKVGLTLDLPIRNLEICSILRDRIDVAPIVITPMISAADISIVIPVKNNQAGINRFLDSLLTNVSPEFYPLEVVIVDNNSAIPIVNQREFPFPVSIITCTRLGPGAARNTGVIHSKGNWILFTDSDCIASESFILGYLTESNTAVAYAGEIDVRGDDYISRYYRDHQVLTPPTRITRNREEPWTLVTANCLVLRAAFEAVGGFDEQFIYAGGEDTDLGYRLHHIGEMKFCKSSVAIHEFNDGLLGLVKRFIRYGKGCRLLMQFYGKSFWPYYESPLGLGLRNALLRWITIGSLFWGGIIHSK